MNNKSHAEGDWFGGDGQCGQRLIATDVDSQLATLPQKPQPGSSVGSLVLSSRVWHWLLLAGGLTSGGLAFGAFFWLVNPPPETNCEDAAVLTTDRALLYCAQLAAATGETSEILAGLDLVNQWGIEHPLHQEILPLAEDWSQTAFNLAKQELRENNLDGAIALIQRIPKFSPNYSQIRAVAAVWQQEWQQGEKLYKQSQQAINNQDWSTARELATSLSQLDNPHWRQAQQQLNRQIRQEQQARKLLFEAKSQAMQGGVERLSGAIQLVSQIDPKTYTWRDAQPFINRWSDMLLRMGLHYWYDARLDQALALAKIVALNPDRAQVSQELIWLIQSRQLARSSLGNWQPQPRQSLQLYQAMLIANQIKAESPFYPQAQSSLATWRLHLQGLMQLQVAQAFSQLQTPNALRLAQARAQMIPVDHPRRLQAQTLVAHWQLDIERLRDRPYLERAHQIAAAGTRDSLSQAIETAGRIQLGRPLRQEAQDWIYVWNHRLETLEDQPLLARAQQQAAVGRWSQAVAIASNIQPGRALYAEARSAIATWQNRLRAEALAQRPGAQPASTSPVTATPADPSPESNQPARSPSSSAPETRANPGPQWSNPQPESATSFPETIPTVPGKSPAAVNQPPEPLRFPDAQLDNPSVPAPALSPGSISFPQQSEAPMLSPPPSQDANFNTPASVAPENLSFD